MGSFKAYLDYVPIPVVEAESVEDGIFKKLSNDLTALQIVGSFGKKRSDDIHKDLDYICDNSKEEIEDFLKKSDIPFYYYPGLRTFSTVILDDRFIARKVDIFQVEDYDFAYSAFYTSHYSVTQFPSFVKSMLLANVVKVHYGEEYSYSPTFALRDKDKNTIEVFWEEFIWDICRLKNPKATVEEFCLNIKTNWSDSKKELLCKRLNKDKRLLDHLKEHSLTIRDLTELLGD